MTAQPKPIKKSSMKTATISLTAGSGQVLKAIRENNISHTYVGIDQNNHKVLQLSYPDAYQPLVEDMFSYMRQITDMESEFTAILEPIIQKQREEDRVLFEAILAKNKNKGKRKTQNTTTQNTNPNTDGNKERK